MTPDQARARFDAARDGELDAEQREAFEDALAGDDALREEYARHRALFDAASNLREAPAVDLLAGVQDKLRARSGGKFYRDRFSRRSGQQSESLRALIVLSACLIVATLLWFAYQAGLLDVR